MREALTVAAVVGRVFTPDLVGRVGGQAPDALADALDEAEHARLVVPARQDGSWAFSHELIRQTLLSDVSTLKRQTMPWRPVSSPCLPPGRVKARKLVTYRRLLF